MKELKKLVLEVISLLIFVALLFSLVRADVLTQDAGGSSNISVSPDEYSENPFSDPAFPSGVPPAEEEEEGGGGGGGAGGVITAYNLSVSPSQFNINMLINTNVRRIISIENIGTSSKTVPISQTGLTNLVLIENSSIFLAAGQGKVAGVIFVAPAVEGVYNGTINVDGISIPVTLNVLEEFILFDSNIVVLNDNYQVPQGEPLRTQVTLIPMGEDVRLDVTLNYVIRNITGDVYLKRSETLLVEGQMSIKRDFDTGGLPLGQYIVELELVYPYGIAPSSAYFDIVENLRDTFSIIVYWIVFLIVVILTILTILIIVRKVKRLKNVAVSSRQRVSVY